MTGFSADLDALAAHFTDHSGAVMACWREAVADDPNLTTGASLPTVQLQDYLPALLEDYCRRVRPRRETGDASLPDRGARVLADQHTDAAAHGLHRWQQGYHLTEVTRELGRFNECVVAELQRFAASRPGMPDPVMATAHRIWAELHSVAIGASTAQFFRLQQIEAASHVDELQRALDSLRELERRRAESWQQAAHDLRGNLGVVATVTAGLSAPRGSEDLRERFLRLLDRNVRSLTHLLEDVTSLARLHGGQERRNVAQFDASAALQDLCAALHPSALERQLTLAAEGPDTLSVDGDVVKVRRIVQNLVLNGIRYTRQGGIRVSWGAVAETDADRWFVQVSDTGPGLHPGARAPVASALEVATEQARQTESAEPGVAHAKDDPSGMLDAGASSNGDGRGNGTGNGTGNGSGSGNGNGSTAGAPPLQAGEGIGLSIVKSLCELLDATMEVESQPGRGTTMRVILPRRYPAGTLN